MVKIGADYLGSNRCRFSVWAPEKESVTLHLVHPAERKIDMQRSVWGYFETEADNIPPGTRYFFMPDGEADYPDPASHFQPEGVHGPSEVVDHSAYSWNDHGWRGQPLQQTVLYELHVGTFTPEGTFEAIIPRLPELAALGISAIELMPVAQFPGARNWGYDGVFPYAVQNSYGGPEGLKKLVDACHAHGIAAYLDVVYNHLGPEGNYFSNYGPYFTSKYATPWGDAINLDGDWSDGVRDYFTFNPQHWLAQYHLDGLRLDAIHAVFDNGADHVWQRLQRQTAEAAKRSGRSFHLIAESDLNSPRVITPAHAGGYGFDAQWLDDFHHALYVLLDPAGKPLYEDFGRMEQLAKAYTDGFVHSGEYVKFRKRRHGTSSAGIPGDRFVVFAQNHDLVGNRVHGERLSVLVPFEKLKLAAAAVLLAPCVPMLFMGEEYGEQAPFLYFVSHADEELVERVREGRKKEFASFNLGQTPPDPQAEATFEASKLNWEARKEPDHQRLLHWYQTLLLLRKNEPLLQDLNKNNIRALPLGQQGLVLQRQSPDGVEQIYCFFNFSESYLHPTLPEWSESWHKIADSQNQDWLREPQGAPEPSPDSLKGGDTFTLPPLSVCLYKGQLI